MTKRLLFPVCAALLGVWIAGSAGAQTPTANTTAANASSTPVPPPTMSNPFANGADSYRIGPGDVLDIRILNRPNLSRDSVRVEGNGTIRMPLIDTEIQAGCKTEGELSKEIAGRYLKFYRNPQVDVFIKEYHSQQVAIIGAVNEQSRFELQRRVRLLDLLTYAKGTSPKAGQAINIVHAQRSQICQKTEVTEEASAFSSYKLSDTL